MTRFDVIFAFWDFIRNKNKGILSLFAPVDNPDEKDHHECPRQKYIRNTEFISWILRGILKLMHGRQIQNTKKCRFNKLRN
jgi:hypothetical protein